MLRRLLLSLVLTCTLVLAFAGTGQCRFDHPVRYYWGDANVDGMRNYGDVTCILDYVAGHIVYINLLNADVSGDGTVTAYDAALLWMWLEANPPITS